MLARPVVAAWTKQTLTDHFFKEAKKQGYVSRAAFKLLEIQKKHKVIKPGGKVLDLGCVPGAWLQVACQQLGPRERGGLVLGVDIQEVSIPPKYCDDRVAVLQADARLLTPQVLQQYTTDGFDTVLSDMLHFTSGVNDVELSLELAGTAMNVATGHYYDVYGEAFEQQLGFKHNGFLRPGGSLVMKVYEGSGTQEFTKLMQQYFTKVVRLRVEASRSMSREFYAIGLGRKQPKKK
ncbi:ribosomal RNA methyltransferase FtsJ domain-containing protein [Scenedesmus sp. NREL 46B-D3]|nr:ribosomal RNA methyltransferase FtsJ domain-containing protein [Scenedesmus sp. NREL 46B-D3]